MNAKTKELLNQPADFETSALDTPVILSWAVDDDGGGLPFASARPFASWLNGVWNGFDDSAGKLTNLGVLKGGLHEWTGGRS